MNADDQPGRAGGAGGESIGESREGVLCLVDHVGFLLEQDGRRIAAAKPLRHRANGEVAHPPFDRVGRVLAGVTLGLCPLMFSQMRTRWTRIRRASLMLSNRSGLPWPILRRSMLRAGRALVRTDGGED